MEIVWLNDENKNSWNEFCLNNSDAWFWHTTFWIDYTVNYNPEAKIVKKSFFIKVDNNYVAICPLLIETYNNIKQFSFGGFAVPTPVIKDDLPAKMSKRIIDFVFNQIDKIAADNNVQKSVFRLNPLSPGFNESKIQQSNILINYGYIDTSFKTQILNIVQNPEIIKRNMRKGHKYDINRSMKMMDGFIYDKNNITKEIFDMYRQLHAKDAGRVTRPLITFEMMYNWILDDYAVLVGVRSKETNEFVGFSYFNIYKNGVYYSSSCSDPDQSYLPTGHLLLWNVIKYLHEKKYKYLELGWQFYYTTLKNYISDKEKAISKFKRGFGGYQVQQFVGEKYYDADIFENEYQKAILNYKQYVANINN